MSHKSQVRVSELYHKFCEQLCLYVPLHSLPDSKHHLAFHHKAYRLCQPPYPLDVRAVGKTLAHQQAGGGYVFWRQDKLPGGDGVAFLGMGSVLYRLACLRISADQDQRLARIDRRNRKTRVALRTQADEIPYLRVLQFRIYVFQAVDFAARQIFQAIVTVQPAATLSHLGQPGPDAAAGAWMVRAWV